MRLNTAVQELNSLTINGKDVPSSEWERRIEVLREERKAGLRTDGNRGYDVITNRFFVDETIYEMESGVMVPKKRNTIHFDDFPEYYGFLDGEIYENACYRFLDLTKYTAFIEEVHIDVSRLMERDALVTETIDDMQYVPTPEELNDFKNNKKVMRRWLSWANKLNDCKTAKEFEKVLKRITNAGGYGYKEQKAFIIGFAVCHPNEDGLEIIKGYLTDQPQLFDDLVRALCTIYDPEQIIECYACYGSKETLKKHKRDLRRYAENLSNGNIALSRRSSFDADKHLYRVNVEGQFKGLSVVKYHIYFTSFEEYVSFLDGDLTNADLTRAYELKVDFSQYKTDETSLFPLTSTEADSSECINGYDNRGFFYAQKTWRNNAGRTLKCLSYKTSYFFDYVHYLKGDLSNADLVLCDGLENLSVEDMNGVKLVGASLTSKICKKFGVPYKEYDYNIDAIVSFEETAQNEASTMPATMWQEDREINVSNGMSPIGGATDNADGNQIVHYISDIHMLHRFRNSECESWIDINRELHDVANTLITEVQRSPFVNGTLLIGGDVASDYEVFSRFIMHLAARRDFYKDHTNIVFVLGNHELWPCAGESLENIIQKYRDLIESNGMYLLHNEILYQDAVERLHRIPYKEIIENDTKTLRDKLLKARMVLLGGIGFSGYNASFNANNGIYRGALNREDEIRETITFESLYRMVIPALHDKNTVIFTHMPYYDWCKDARRENGFVYVSGHTHHNDYYDDGDQRYYADNQIGYGTKPVHLRSFTIGSEYDVFAEYEDGIYEITREQYLDFCVGKHLRAAFNNNTYVKSFHMLKKNGYYCFILRWTNGKLAILNGGQVKNLEKKDLQYYYNHMDDQIAQIMEPLSKFTEIQKKVARAIKDIGGVGTIHGCIVDIDFLNHIYVNPYDVKLTAYWAENIVNKLAYPSIPALLKQNCPRLYGQLLKRIEDTSMNALVPAGCMISKDTVYDAPVEYRSTDIYKASREIKKMQKLSKNVLTTWYDLKEERINRQDILARC